MTLHEALQKMLELNFDPSEAVDVEWKPVEAEKDDTGTLYMAIPGKNKSSQPPKDVSGIKVYTGDNKNSILDGKHFINYKNGIDILRQDKSNLLTVGSIEAKRKDGKGTVNVPFLGVKSDKQGNPDINGDKAIATNASTVMKLKNGETKSIVVSNGAPATSEGDDGNAIKKVEQEIAIMDPNNLPGPYMGGTPANIDKETSREIQTIISKVNSSLPATTENGTFTDVDTIIQKYLNDNSVSPQERQRLINANNGNELAKTFDIKPIENNDKNATKNPFENFKNSSGRLSKIFSSILGGVAELAGRFVGGLAAGKAGTAK